MSSFWQAVAVAGHGIWDTLKQERNFRRQLLVLAGVLVAAWWLRLPFTSLALILVMSGVVLTAELFNTALETLADVVHPEQHPAIRLAKDVAAGAVLMAGVLSLLVGGLLFAEALLSRLGQI